MLEMRKFLPKVALAFLFLSFFSLVFAAVTRLVWQSEGIIFSDSTINNVEVIELEDGRYRMYFHQGPTQMKSAISTDGKTFTLESGTRLTGTMPSLVKLPNGTWRMYFKSGTDVFKSATSTDGLTWKVEAGERLRSGGQNDPDDIAHPTVVALPEGGYRMYYDGETRKTEQEFTWRVLSATSTDGLNFVKDEGIRLDVNVEPLLSGLSFSAHALYEGGVYYLYFAAERSEGEPSGIYLATSENGLTFTVQQEPLLAQVVTPAPGEIPNYPQDPFVLKLASGDRMFYWTTDGLFSALQVEQDVPQDLPWWQEIWQKFLTFLRELPGVDLGNLELFIVPGILFAATAVVIYLFVKFSRR